MKRILIVALMIFAASASGECATTSFFPPLQPKVTQTEDLANTMSSANNNDNNFTNQLKDSFANLNKIELTLFGRAYNNQNVNSRLSRVEKALFSTTYPKSSNSQRIDNIISNFNQINKNPNISRNALSRLESKIFNQSFQQNSAQRRIERLEQQIFGAEQSGDLDARLKALQIAAKSYNNKNNVGGEYDDFSNSTYTQGNSGIKGLLGNWGGGTITGFSPSINPYSAYNNSGHGTNYGTNYGMNNPYNFYNRVIGNQGYNQSIRTNRGYRDVFKSYGSGAGVTILD